MDQYSVVLQIQVHTVVWLKKKKKSIHRYNVIFAAGTSAREQDAAAESVLQLISIQSSAPLKSPMICQILQDWQSVLCSSKHIVFHSWQEKKVTSGARLQLLLVGAKIRVWFHSGHLLCFSEIFRITISTTRHIHVSSYPWQRGMSPVLEHHLFLLHTELLLSYSMFCIYKQFL